MDVHSAPLLDPDFIVAKSESKSFDQVAGFHHMPSNDNLTGVGDPVRVTRAAVTANFFSMLGVVPQLGRNFLSSEDWRGSPNVVMLSDRFRKNKFNADAGSVGKAITLNEASYTVIGVFPRYFSFPSPSLEPDLYGSAALERYDGLIHKTTLVDSGYRSLASWYDRRTSAGGDAGFFSGDDRERIWPSEEVPQFSFRVRDARRKAELVEGKRIGQICLRKAS